MVLSWRAMTGPWASLDEVREVRSAGGLNTRLSAHKEGILSKFQKHNAPPREDNNIGKSRVVYLEGLCSLLLFISIGYPDMVSKWLELTTVVILIVCVQSGCSQ